VKERYVYELDKTVGVNAEGMNVLCDHDANWLAMRDALRDISADEELRGHTGSSIFAGTAYVKDGEAYCAP
jgi:hypothetical protein